MTRIENGIYDTVELDSGFFITDNQADLISEWLSSYADALEKAWIKRGAEGDEKVQKHTMVRSFVKAVARYRVPKAEGGEKKEVVNE